MSILVCGNEDMHVELRVRTVCELVLNESHYLRPENSSFIGGFVDDGITRSNLAAPRLHVLSAGFTTATSRPIPSDSSLAQETFQIECQETTVQNTFCGMWHIHALSTVVQSPICSVYPNHNLYVRPLLHKTVFPRNKDNHNCASDKTMHIMWTRICPMSANCITGHLHHSVPIQHLFYLIYIIAIITFC